MFFLLYRRVLVTLFLSVCAWSSIWSSTCRAEDHTMLCSYGYGSFSSKFATGITVTVEPVRKAAFASRVCSAALSWKGGALPVTPSASEVDIDVLGADLGLNSPVVGLQIRNNGGDKLVSYDIYSLQKPAHQLRTLTGGDYFAAADTDLDGRIEIWTDDAAAMDGFENLSLGTFDAAPTVVLRFEQHRLIDVSAEFPSEYDRQIAALKAELSAEQLGRFKNSDGKLADRSALPIDQAHALMAAKIKILEIVCAYLYSGREQEAWETLTAMWPAADVDRIRAAIQRMRTNGMRSKVDGVAGHASGIHIKKHALIYEAELDYDKNDPAKMFQADSAPREILLRRPPLAQTTSAALSSETILNLVVDAAGKVRKVSPEGKADKELLAATADWKFIPAFKNGQAVASRIRYGVTPYQ